MRALSSVTTCQTIFPAPCSSCVEPFTPYPPRSRKQFSLQVSKHLVHTEHYRNLISKNTTNEQCSKANGKVLLITFSPTAAVFCTQPLWVAKAQHQGQLIFRWSMVAQRQTPPAQVLQAGVCHQDLCSGIKMRLKKIMKRKPGHSHTNLGCEAAGDSLSSNSCRFLPSPPLPAVLPPACSCTHAQQVPFLGAFGFPAPSSIPEHRPHILHPAGMEKKEWCHSNVLRSYMGGRGLLLEEASIARDQWQVQCSLHSEESWAQRTADGDPCSSQDSRSHSCTLKGHIFHVSNWGALCSWT